MKRFLLPLLLIGAVVLAACSAPPVAASQPMPQSPSSSTNEGNASSGLTRSDEQGAVTFEVTPLNLDASADTLEFDVAMNTHSVDLSMDLASLATLSTDTGTTVQATKWDATPGGHHVSGKLIFPATQNGKSILEGVSKLTLTIVKVDAPSRLFEWELQ